MTGERTGAIARIFCWAPGRPVFTPPKRGLPSCPLEKRGTARRSAQPFSSSRALSTTWRLSARHRGSRCRPEGSNSAPGRASWDVALAGVTRRGLSQSSELLAERSSCRPGGAPEPPGGGGTNPARGHHTRLHPPNVSGRRPSVSRTGLRLYTCGIKVKCFVNKMLFFQARKTQRSANARSRGLPRAPRRLSAATA
jgi:hypothetical protein